MEVTVNNLGPLKQAEFEIGDLTIICGENNTGKSYLTHATHGFLEAVQEMTFPVKNDVIEKILNGSSVVLPLAKYRRSLNKHIATFSNQYSKVLNTILAGADSRFKNSKFQFHLEGLIDSYGRSIYSVYSQDALRLEIQSSNDQSALEIVPIANGLANKETDQHVIEEAISTAIRWALISAIPKPIISSAERTGISIFQPELDFTKNRIWDLLGNNSSKKDLSLSMIRREFGGVYPRATSRNIDAMRRWPNIAQQESDLLRRQPDLMHFFSDIIGGDLRISNEGIITFTPSSNKNIKLSILESSSTVRSLLDINFYIRHIAGPENSDILIIDEPEMNLHPKNQCKLARLFARFVNAGVKVFISTHSDYILKEINTLIMLNDNDRKLQRFAVKEGYDVKSELLRPEQIKAYRTTPIEANANVRSQHGYYTLAPMEINSKIGITAPSFDETIIHMNRIQDEILWGDHNED